MKYTLYIPFVYLLLTSCGKPEEEPKNQKFVLSETMKKGMETSIAELRNVERTIPLNGKVSFNEDHVAKVFPLAGGFVKELYVELGDYVKKGQVMAIIRSPEIAGFTNEGIAAQAQVRVSEKNAMVAQELYKTGNISEIELINAQKDLENAKAELERINNVLDMYGVGEGSVYPIKSPVSGVIIQKNIALNMELRTEDISPAFIVGSLDDVWVMANIYESDISTIKEGFKTEITTTAYPDKIFSGKIDKIFSLMDVNSKVVKARITLQNENFILKPEMFANVNVTFTEPYKKVAIPSSAVIFDKSTYFVMILKGNDDIETREVVVNSTFNGISYIESGLEAGDKVITKLQLLIYDALND